MYFSERVQSLDSFGVEVGLKMAGQRYYKTVCGGLATVTLTLLSLLYFCLRIQAVVTHEDASLSVFELIENRDKQVEPINLSDHSLQVFWLFVDQEYRSVPLDPRIGVFKLIRLTTWFKGNKLNEDLQSLDFVEVNMKSDTSAAELLTVYEPDARGIYAPANLAECEQKGHWEAKSTIQTMIQFVPCAQTGHSDCASEQELATFLANHQFALVSAINFINMNVVKTKDQTLEKGLQSAITGFIDKDKPQQLLFKLIEHRAEFEDDRVNIFGLNELKELRYLNLDENYKQHAINRYEHFTVSLTLSMKVINHRREVYEILDMLGDVGGLHDFLALSLSAIFALFSQNFMTDELVQRLFHVSHADQPDAHREVPRTPPAQLFRSIKPLIVTKCFTFLSALTCMRLPQSKLRRKALKIGASRLDETLDIVALVRQRRKLNTLIRLLFPSKQDRKLLAMQRRDSVIEVAQNKKIWINTFQTSSSDDAKYDQAKAYTRVKTIVLRTNSNSIDGQDNFTTQLKKGVYMRSWDHTPNHTTNQNHTTTQNHTTGIGGADTPIFGSQVEQSYSDPIGGSGGGGGGGGGSGSRDGGRISPLNYSRQIDNEMSTNAAVQMTNASTRNDDMPLRKNFHTRKRILIAGDRPQHGYQK